MHGSDCECSRLFSHCSIRPPPPQSPRNPHPILSLTPPHHPPPLPGPLQDEVTRFSRKGFNKVLTTKGLHGNRLSYSKLGRQKQRKINRFGQPQEAGLLNTVVLAGKPIVNQTLISLATKKKCCDKIMFVATQLFLSGQKFCHDKHVCRDKSSVKCFVATSILLLRQKTCLLWQK